MITVLMSVYSGEKPEFLRAAFESLECQTRKPVEILLIKDGPVGAKLESVIAAHQKTLGFRILSLPENLGLAKALNLGLREATQPWIMRFDSDDICVPTRIEVQSKKIEKGNVDLFGSQIAEFDIDPKSLHRSRIVPLSHDEILAYSLSRNPFNHMTVCYARQMALDCGG